MFFLLPSYSRILSIFTFILFGKTNTKYILTRHLTWMIPNDLYIWKLTWYVFLNKREVLSRFIGKSNIFKYFSTCQTHSNDFWIMNTICMSMNLFVVYFSYVPVISASIHRYVNYFDIQILMMVTETETLTSNLHHNIFTYLDYASHLWSIQTIVWVVCFLDGMNLEWHRMFPKYFRSELESSSVV